MRLNSASGQFVFNLPTDFVPQEISETYQPLLEKNWVQYENVIDYLNSTIKEVSSPGLSIDTAEQMRMRGKKVNYKPSTNVQDIVSSRQLDITFREVDQGLNYWIMYDIFIKHYLDTEYIKFVPPFTITAVDIHRDAIYDLKFREIILVSLSENRFSYNDQAFDEKTFSLTVNFNWYDIEFKMHQKKLLDLKNPGSVIQVLPQNPDDFKPKDNRPHLPNGGSKS
jgi:hypothetical protein